MGAVVPSPRRNRQLKKRLVTAFGVVVAATSLVSCFKRAPKEDDTSDKGP